MKPKVIWFLSLRLTAAYMAFAMLLKILRPGGMAESHFNQSPSETARKYRALKYVWRSLIPLIIVATLGELDPSRLADDVIGQMVALTMLAVTLFLVYPLFRSRSHLGEQNDLLQWFSAAALTLAPIALIVLVVLGYYYTALKLTNRFIDTFYLFMAWSIIQQTAIPWPVGSRPPSGSSPGRGSPRTAQAAGRYRCHRAHRRQTHDSSGHQRAVVAVDQGGAVCVAGR